MRERLRRAADRVRAAGSPLRAFRLDVARVAATRPERTGVGRFAALAGDASLWALALLRGGVAARALVGSSLGAHTVLRLAFHIDVWTDRIGGGLRLPHPFQIVIGEGVQVGAGCTLMHGVTIQRARGAPTQIGDGCVVGAQAVVLEGARVGARSLIGAASVVRAGATPPSVVLVGAPARVVRQTREGEVAA